MSQKQIFKGVFLIGLAATGYGMLATIVKLAYKSHFSPAEVTFSQLAYGLLGMSLIYLIQKSTSKSQYKKVSKKEILQLTIAGTTIGFTSIFYYLSVLYVPASIGIVLLMQAIWISIVIEAFIEKKLPSKTKIFSVLIILSGTVLATNLLGDQLTINWQGGFFGLLAAISFALTMYASNQIAVQSAAAERTLFMLIGGFITALAYLFLTQTGNFNFEIFASWGIPLAFFGAIFPPLLMNVGFPHTGIGLGSIVASLELPVAVIVAYFVLNETVIAEQWIGIGLIILAIVMINMKKEKC